MFTYKQADRQTNKQTNITENITSFAKEVIVNLKETAAGQLYQEPG